MKKTIAYVIALISLSLNANAAITITTNAATDITSDGATLNLTLGTADEAGWLNVGFNYGTDSGNLTSQLDLGLSRSDPDEVYSSNSGAWYYSDSPELGWNDGGANWGFEPTVSLTLSGLQPNTTYYFQGVAVSGVSGANLGSELSFTTTVIPESSVYAMFTGLLSLGVVVYRRKN